MSGDTVGGGDCRRVIAVTSVWREMTSNTVSSSATVLLLPLPASKMPRQHNLLRYATNLRQLVLLFAGRMPARHGKINTFSSLMWVYLCQFS